MTKAAAWVMQVDHVVSVAVGQMESVHIVDNPEYIKLPKAPHYCNNVIIWNEKIIPVINVVAWINDSEAMYHSGNVVIAVYRDGVDDSLKYGGIYLANTPVLEYVDNTQMCPLPSPADKWRKISISCFRSKENHSVPILNLAKIFSGSLLNNDHKRQAI